LIVAFVAMLIGMAIHKYILKPPVNQSSNQESLHGGTGHTRTDGLNQDSDNEQLIAKN